MTARYACGDCFTQVVVEGKPFKDVDKNRSMWFSVFGGGITLYCYPVYNKLLPWLRTSPAAGVALDLLLVVPVYFVAFYGARECIRQRGVSRENLHAGLIAYRNAFWRDLKMYVVVWTPLHFVNFLLIPVHLRMPAMANLGMIWVIVLSFFTGKGVEEALKHETAPKLTEG